MAHIIRPKETWKKPENFIDKAKQDLAADDYVPYEGHIVAVVDKLMEMAKKRGYPTHVSTEEDWLLVEQIIKMWATLYPEQSEEFWKSQQYKKSIQKNEFASNKEGEALVRHLVEIPQKLWDLIHAVFPQQKAQDKKFALKFGQRLPAFRWSSKV